MKKQVTSRAAVLQAIKECDLLGRDRFLDRHGFNTSRTYTLLHEGNEYDSKAIHAVAFGYQYPEIGNLNTHYPSGGKDGAGKNLHLLGFEIRGITRNPDDWSVAEVDKLVTDYFEMLSDEMAGKQFNKAEHRRNLKARGVNRSHSSIEMKHQNVSAVLDDLGLPYIFGYKPRRKRQALLESMVVDYLSTKPGIIDEQKFSSEPKQRSSSVVFVDPPSTEQTRSISDNRGGVKVDYAAREAAQRRLGEAGESWVVEIEKDRLIALGRDDLANEIVWASKELGDGLGYDVRSFDEDGSEFFIEVKTTRRGINEPFMISANEVKRSSQLGTKFAIYRVFDFGTNPSVYVLRGPVEQSCRLEVTNWRAWSMWGN